MIKNRFTLINGTIVFQKDPILLQSVLEDIEDNPCPIGKRTRAAQEYWQRYAKEEIELENKLKADGKRQEEIDKELDEHYKQWYNRCGEKL